MSTFEPPAESDWHRMIAEAAYFFAERRAFQPGKERDDWLEAEAQIKKALVGE